eukprot:403361816
MRTLKSMDKICLILLIDKIESQSSVDLKPNKSSLKSNQLHDRLMNHVNHRFKSREILDNKNFNNLQNFQDDLKTKSKQTFFNQNQLQINSNFIDEGEYKVNDNSHLDQNTPLSVEELQQNVQLNTDYLNFEQLLKKQPHNQHSVKTSTNNLNMLGVKNSDSNSSKIATHTIPSNKSSQRFNQERQNPVTAQIIHKKFVGFLLNKKESSNNLSQNTSLFQGSNYVNSNAKSLYSLAQNNRLKRVTKNIMRVKGVTNDIRSPNIQNSLKRKFTFMKGLKSQNKGDACENMNIQLNDKDNNISFEFYDKNTDIKLTHIKRKNVEYVNLERHLSDLKYSDPFFDGMPPILYNIDDHEDIHHQHGSEVNHNAWKILSSQIIGRQTKETLPKAELQPQLVKQNSQKYGLLKIKKTEQSSHFKESINKKINESNKKNKIIKSNHRPETSYEIFKMRQDKSSNIFNKNMNFNLRKEDDLASAVVAENIRIKQLEDERNKIEEYKENLIKNSKLKFKISLQRHITQKFKKEGNLSSSPTMTKQSSVSNVSPTFDKFSKSKPTREDFKSIDYNEISSHNSIDRIESQSASSPKLKSTFLKQAIQAEGASPIQLNQHRQAIQKYKTMMIEQGDSSGMQESPCSSISEESQNDQFNVKIDKFHLTLHDAFEKQKQIKNHIRNNSEVNGIGEKTSQLMNLRGINYEKILNKRPQRQKIEIKDYECINNKAEVQSRNINSRESNKLSLPTAVSSKYENYQQSKLRPFSSSQQCRLQNVYSQSVISFDKISSYLINNPTSQNIQKHGNEQIKNLKSLKTQTLNICTTTKNVNKGYQELLNSPFSSAAKLYRVNLDQNLKQSGKNGPTMQEGSNYTRNERNFTQISPFNYSKNQAQSFLLRTETEKSNLVSPDKTSKVQLLNDHKKSIIRSQSKIQVLMKKQTSKV